jgi:hypothetical protein
MQMGGTMYFNRKRLLLTCLFIFVAGIDFTGAKHALAEVKKEVTGRGAAGSDQRERWCKSKLTNCVNEANNECDIEGGSSLDISLCKQSEVGTCNDAYGKDSSCTTREKINPGTWGSKGKDGLIMDGATDAGSPLSRNANQFKGAQPAAVAPQSNSGKPAFGAKANALKSSNMTPLNPKSSNSTGGAKTGFGLKTTTVKVPGMSVLKPKNMPKPGRAKNNSVSNKAPIKKAIIKPGVEVKPKKKPAGLASNLKPKGDHVKRIIAKPSAKEDTQD